MRPYQGRILQALCAFVGVFSRFYTVFQGVFFMSVDLSTGNRGRACRIEVFMDVFIDVFIDVFDCSRVIAAVVRATRRRRYERSVARRSEALRTSASIHAETRETIVAMGPGTIGREHALRLCMTTIRNEALQKALATGASFTRAACCNRQHRGFCPHPAS